MRLLLLGGTADGRKLAEALYQNGVSLIYSVAGLVRVPQVGCDVVSGGFSQFGGLDKYIARNNITAILDVTHPFAEKMSTTAVNVARQYGIPCWRFHRQAWLQDERDQWQLFSNWAELIDAVKSKKRLFLTVGQVTQPHIDALSHDRDVVVFRTAVPPKVNLPDNVEWIKAIGPFSEEDEQALFRYYRFDALISKNSGGDATKAKLIAARESGTDVYMLERPVLPATDEVFYDHESCRKYVVEYYELNENRCVLV